MPAPLITLTATFQDLTGQPIGSVSNPCMMRIDLCGYGQFLPVIPGTSVLAQVEMEILSTNGSFSVPLWGNDQILEGQTFYAITVLDGKKRVVQSGNYFLNAGGVATAVDLSAAGQLIQPVLLPPLASETAYEFAIGTGSTAGSGPYALPTAPAVGTILKLYYNGNLLIPGQHYTLAGATITLLGFATVNGDNLYALYYKS